MAEKVEGDSTQLLLLQGFGGSTDHFAADQQWLKKYAPYLTVINPIQNPQALRSFLQERGRIA